MPVIFAEMITELKSETFIACNFLELSFVSFCHFQKRSSHLISQNSSPHARHRDGMCVNHPKFFCSGARSKCWNLSCFLVSQTVKMLEVVGSLVKHTVKMLRAPHGQDAGKSWIFKTCTVKMLEILVFLCEFNHQNA